MTCRVLFHITQRPVIGALCLSVSATLVGACSSTDGGSQPSDATGGTVALGGNAGVGGSTGTGGLTSGSGGTGGSTGVGGTTVGSGGTIGTAGARATEGAAPPTGGQSNSTGGAPTSGGTNSTGGASPKGGTNSTGGASVNGGTNSTGGASVTGGTSSTGGASATGGRSTGGSVGQGGSTGGQASVGGSTAVGGSSGASGYAPCPTNGDPCKILPFGDSITNGVASTDLGGYRSQLFKLVVAAQQKVTFTGSQSSGPAQVSGVTFPKNHEGRSGWTIDPGYSSYGAGGISTLVPTPAFSTIPNIVLLMIGTNDVTYTSGQSTMTNRLETLLDKIVQTAPNALIVLATLTPLSWNPAALSDYNAKLPGIVSVRAAKGQHIVGVDMSKMPLTSLATDNVHPNDQGYSYMAGVWYAAIKDLLPK